MICKSHQNNAAINIRCDVNAEDCKYSKMQFQVMYSVVWMWLHSHFLCVLFTPIIRASQWLLLHGGDSQKTEHLRVIENKVLDPSQMHDMQSGGHTWLLADKTLSSSNSCSRIVVSMGDKKTLPMAFKSFQCPPILGELFDRGQREICSLCSGPGRWRAFTLKDVFLLESAQVCAFLVKVLDVPQPA